MGNCLPVSKSFDTISATFSTDVDAKTVEEIFEGVLEGFAGMEAPDVLTCVKDSTSTVGDFKSAVADFEKKTIAGMKAGLQEVAQGLEGLKSAMTDCKSAEAEVQKLVKAMEQLKTPKELIYHVGKDLLLNHKDILAKVEDAVSSYKGGQWEAFGKDIGGIVADLVGVPSGVTGIVPMAKPVFDGTFGANCPPCKEFGSTVLKQLYAADGIADAVDFEMHSAIRSAGDPSKDHSWDCPDEDAGCPMTKWFLCAVDGWNKNTTTQDQRVNFLTCWDDATGDAEAKAKTCAAAGKLDFDAISKCNSGSKAEDLELAAAKYFEQRFPTHAHSGMFMVPHVFINGKDIGENRDYHSILKMLCDTGIKAGACTSLWKEASV
jgi:glutaredoxin